MSNYVVGPDRLELSTHGLKVRPGPPSPSQLSQLMCVAYPDTAERRNVLNVIGIHLVLIIKA